MSCQSEAEKVEWGHGSGIYIRKDNLDQMTYLEKDCEWATAFLKGVYGDQAKYMRTTVREGGDPNSKAIPQDVLKHAKSMYNLKQ